MSGRRRYASSKSAATRARYAKRRQRRLSRVDNDLTDEQWFEILDVWAGCAYCQATGPALQRDCVQPISRGGRYTVENVVPACASCNASKHNSEVTGWMRRKKLDEGAFLLRHATFLQALRAATQEEVPELEAGPGPRPGPGPDGDDDDGVGVGDQHQEQEQDSPTAAHPEADHPG